MTKKLLSTLLFSALAVGLPLAGRADLWLHWRVLVVLAVIALLMCTQPALASPKETSREDRHTMWGILGLSLLAVAAPVTEWAWLRPLAAKGAADGWSWLGLLLVGLGCGLRLWAIAALGRWFTAEVKIQAGQPLVTSGPYRFVRHPSYLGAWLAALGVAVLLEAWAGAAVAATAMFWAYRARIAAEEVVLARHFSEDWAAFAAGRWRLIPLVW